MTASESASVTALARMGKELARLEGVARARLKGTPAEKLVARAETLVERLPTALEREVDALLDRVGLVRKARLTNTTDAGASRVDAAASTDPAAPVTASVADVAPGEATTSPQHGA